VAAQVFEIESRPGPTDFDELAPLVKGTRGRELLERGDQDHGVWSAGMVIGLINDVPSCEELIQRIVHEAETVIRQRLNSLMQ